MRYSTLFVATVATLLIGILVTPTAQAVPITYTFSGIASGILGESTFTDTAFSFIVIGDTDNVNQNFGPGVFSNFGLPASFTVGAASGTLTDTVYVFDNHNLSAAGIGSTNNVTNPTPFLDMAQAFLGTYNMTSPLAPVTGTLNFNTTEAIKTSAGDLVFSSANAVSSPTFGATGGIAVPEAGTLGLVLPTLGLMGMSVGFVLRRKK